MFEDLVTSDSVLLWLSGRNKKNIRVISNPIKLLIGFVDISSGDYVKFKIREAKNKRIAKLYQRINKLPIEGGAMFQDWISEILA
jgi:hypothetical protein